MEADWVTLATLLSVSVWPGPPATVAKTFTTLRRSINGGIVQTLPWTAFRRAGERCVIRKPYSEPGLAIRLDGRIDMSGQPRDVSPRTAPRTPWLPQRWFTRAAWVVHRAIYRFTGGRRGLALPKPGRCGYLRLKTVGRRSRKERIVILAYYEDGPNLVTLAMNGWANGEPAWWLNLRAQPAASVDLKSGARAVRWERNGRAFGPDSTATAAGATASTRTLPCGRPRRRSLSWSHGLMVCPDG